MKIGEKLYSYIWRNVQANNCNTFIIRTEKITCLIDPGLKVFLPPLFSLMEKDGIQPEEINTVILTHCHPDHMEGGVKLKEMGARIGIHQDDDTYIKEVGPSLAASLGMKMPDISFDFFLQEGELVLGDERLQVLHTPGHSPGAISLFWEENKVLFSGDLVFAQGVGRTDFPGGDGAKLKSSLQRCSKLGASMLMPGHGEAITTPEEVKNNFDMIEQYYFDSL